MQMALPLCLKLQGCGLKQFRHKPRLVSLPSHTLGMVCYMSYATEWTECVRSIINLLGFHFCVQRDKTKKKYRVEKAWTKQIIFMQDFICNEKQFLAHEYTKTICWL